MAKLYVVVAEGKENSTYGVTINLVGVYPDKLTAKNVADAQTYKNDNECVNARVIEVEEGKTYPMNTSWWWMPASELRIGEYLE